MSASRRHSRPGILTVLLLLAIFTVLGLTRLGHLAAAYPELMAWFLVPVAVAFALGVLLIVEMQRVEKVQAAFKFFTFPVLISLKAL